MPALRTAAPGAHGERSVRRTRRARRRHDESTALLRSPAPARTPQGPGRRTPAELLQMQRLFGNRAVQRYVESTRSDVIHRCGATPCDCPAEKKAAARMPEEMALGRLVQRDFPGLGDLIPNLEDLPLEQIVDQFAPDTESAAPNPSCTSDFCAPMSSLKAQALRAAASGPILAGIAAKVNTRVVGLWSQHIFGGAAPQDLSSQFGSDFESSATTADTTTKLVDALKLAIEANPPTFPAGTDTVILNIATLIPDAIAAIHNPKHADVMDFDVISEIPGNIAGGVGKDQLSQPVGARPAPFNDERKVHGSVSVTKNPDGTLTCTPHMMFTVRDTIDLCPGNCGAAIEQVATRPLSWLEASGVSGDVPFSVEFGAPTSPFTVTPTSPAPPPPTPTGPVEGQVQAHPRLRIRESPTTASAILARYPNGTKITIECQVTGEMIDGNDKWDKTDKGYVSDRYVRRDKQPANC